MCSSEGLCLRPKVGVERRRECDEYVRIGIGWETEVKYVGMCDSGGGPNPTLTTLQLYQWWT